MSWVLKILFSWCAFCVSTSFQATCPATLITDMNQKNCTDRATNETAYYLDRTNCIPKCSIYPTAVQNLECTNDPTACIAGYNCESRCGRASSYQEYVCETDADCAHLARAVCLKYCMLPTVDDSDKSVPCMAYHSNIANYVNKWWTAEIFKPVCDDEGNWAPKQCKGGLQGRCLCYSSSGIRLFGQALYTESANMTCACSRRKSDLESSGRSYVSLHCDSMGNYESLQCDVEKSICWCVDPLTSDLTAPVVPAAAMNKLPCYSEDNVGVQYLRQCESKKYASAMITSKLKKHGVVTVEADTLLCSADGSYGAYSISSGIAYCTWRDNSKIGTWQVDIGGLTGELTCNCARDFKMYEHSQSCEGNGNYVLLQQTLDESGKKKYYCVDADGFAKTSLIDDSTKNCTLVY